jgi:beta-galactosidase
VYVNGKKVGELNRMTKTYTMDISIPFNGILEIFVENMGRINYGAQIPMNKKGIISPVMINDFEITGNWQMYKIPMETMPQMNGQANAKPGNPVFYAASFDLKKTGDTFLDLQGWGKGIVFVNGINLGRYWKLGPQQTLYLPGCWLKKGKNEILIFEQLNETIHSVIKTTDNPVLEGLKF